MTYFMYADAKGDRTALSALPNSLRLSWKLEFGSIALLWITLMKLPGNHDGDRISIIIILGRPHDELSTASALFRVLFLMVGDYTCEKRRKGHAVSFLVAYINKSHRIIRFSSLIELRNYEKHICFYQR